MMLNMSSSNSSSSSKNNSNSGSNDGHTFNNLYEQSYQQEQQQQQQLQQQLHQHQLQHHFLPYNFHLQQQHSQYQLNYNCNTYNNNNHNNTFNENDTGNQVEEEEKEEEQKLELEEEVENEKNNSMCANETIENNKMSQNVAATCSSKSERESIHSGHFMVSQFEAEEEAQDDLDDDDVADEVQMPSLASQTDESIPCTEVQLYVPRKVTNFQHAGNSGANSVIGRGGVGSTPGGIKYDIGSVASHVEIETSLTKLFKCMSLAYSQKLTSPKWNHFKGVRLRWKDKIRLNNVIWRCWHMQFILKKRTPVCQFASPLDVDIHSNPESVVLEGKYWKRQLAVIKAEYRKWRRNFKTKAIGCLTYDTKSEFDLLDWSPSFMLTEDWTSDTLFSAINGPFPFPDPREIARAGIADFIQPSLGPLQPNLEDIDVTFQELLQSTRLPSVPEEPADDMLKGVDYNGFQAIMGPPEQMDASNIMDNVVATTTNTNVAIASNALSNTNNSNNNNNSNNSNNNDDVDTNMLELNTPLNQLQYSDIEQQFVARDNSGGMLLAHNAVAVDTATNSEDQLMTDNNLRASSSSSCGKHNLKHYNSNVTDVRAQLNNDHSASGGKSVMKGRISKSFQRLYRREPHNYDKAQPTFHQTSIYQQILAEQQKNHLQQQTNVTTSYQQAQQQQQQLCYQYQTAASSGVGIGGSDDAYIYANDNNSSPQTATTKTTILNTSRTSNLIGTTATAAGVRINLAPTVQQQQQQQITTKSNVIVSPNNNNNNNNNNTNTNNISITNAIKLEPTCNDVLCLFNLTTGASGETPTVSTLLTTSSPSSTTTCLANKADLYAPVYKPYPTVNSNGEQQQHIFKKSSSTGTFVNIRGWAPAISNYLIAQQQQQQQPPSPQTTTTQQQMQHTQSLPLSMPIMSTAQQQQQQQQQLNTFSMQQQQLVQEHQLSPTTSPEQLAVIEQQQQQQQSIFPKEMYRSNSLPLNVTLHKVDNFLVPKYTAHGGNTVVGNKSYSGSSASLLNTCAPNVHTLNARGRSNSMQPNIIMASNFYPAPDNTTDNNNGRANGSITTSNGVDMNSNNYLNAPTQLQTATSDPMLNSTLAQLLTSNTRMPNFINYNNKQHQQIQQQLQQQSSNVNQQYNLIAPQQQQQQNSIFLNQQKKDNVAGAVSSLELQAVRVQQQMQRHMQLQQQQQLHHQQQQQLQQQQQQQQNASSIIKTIITTSAVAAASSSSLTTSASSSLSSSLLLTKQNKSPKKTQSLPAIAPPLPLLHSPPNKVKSFPLSGNINCAGSMNKLSLSPESFHEQDSPLSPTHSLSKFPRDNQRRAGHIHAEQKRRYNIKNGFDMLHSLIPQLQQNPNIKLSKAAMLQKGAEHIKHLRCERNVLQERMEALRQERDSLNNSLTHLHSILPANGAPVTRQGTEHVRQLYEQYVRYRTNEHNWKFWILGLILEPLLSSYTASVSSANMDEMRRTAFLWVDQHCSLIDLRPAVSNKLKYLSMKTDILSDPPSLLEEEVAKAINYTAGQHPNLHGT